jgi:hypothetical protein
VSVPNLERSRRGEREPLDLPPHHVSRWHISHARCLPKSSSWNSCVVIASRACGAESSRGFLGSHQRLALRSDAPACRQRAGCSSPVRRGIHCSSNYARRPVEMFTADVSQLLLARSPSLHLATMLAHGDPRVRKVI